MKKINSHEKKNVRPKVKSTLILYAFVKTLIFLKQVIITKPNWTVNVMLHIFLNIQNNCQGFVLFSMTHMLLFPQTNLLFQSEYMNSLISELTYSLVILTTSSAINTRDDILIIGLFYVPVEFQRKYEDRDIF